jgi:hypothetical protein
VELFMSRSRSRKCKCRRRLEAELREAFEKARHADANAARAGAAPPGHGELWAVLCKIVRSDFSVWEIARGAHCTDDENAMFAQAAAPELAGMTPGSVVRRREREKPRPSRKGRKF